MDAYDMTEYAAARYNLLGGGASHWFPGARDRSEEHTSELQSHSDLVCRLLLEKKNLVTHSNTSSNPA